MKRFAQGKFSLLPVALECTAVDMVDNARQFPVSISSLPRQTTLKQLVAKWCISKCPGEIQPYSAIIITSKTALTLKDPLSAFYKACPTRYGGIYITVTIPVIEHGISDASSRVSKASSDLKRIRFSGRYFQVKGKQLFIIVVPY